LIPDMGFDIGTEYWSGANTKIGFVDAPDMSPLIPLDVMI
jgi:hypothetical protein